MKEHASLILTIFAIFALLALGAFFSPTYTQKIGYAQWFLYAGGLLFIASLVIIVATFGFHAFSLYLTVLIAAAIAAFGLYGGFLVVILTYLSWGFVFSIQLLLVHHRVPTAISWFQERYSYRAFSIEYWVFYPMLWLFFLLFERLPHLFHHDRIVTFDPSETLRFMKSILKND